MANQVQFNIQRIYLKDLSFESPMTPDVFTNMSSSPKVGFNFESNINNITDDIYELTLFFNVKAEVEDKTLYLVELKQCGVFSISTDDEAMRKRFLNVHCAEIVYPYARENISNVIQTGGFPPLFLSPIDFHTIYQNELDKRKDS
ncbi:MAG: protein-export chaperone SecB [Gammaproteobacteria bacterium]